MADGLQCPKCETALAITIDHRLGERVCLAITPNTTGLINAKTAGGVLENFGKLLESIAKDSGYRAEAIVRDIKFSETGELRFDVEMIPLVTKPVKRKPKQNEGKE